MHDAHIFLVNIAIVLCVAAVTTVVFQKLRQPVVLGYLLAGAIVSPHTPFPLFADEATIYTLSELGVILLMFSLGLEFNFSKVIRVSATAAPIAIVQCSLMIWLGYVTGQLFGWTALESFYAGALIAISSTTIIVKAFAEQGIHGRLTEIVFGVLIMEDIIAILLLAVLTTVSVGSGPSAGSLVATTGKLVLFLAAVIGGGMLIVPRTVRAILRLNRPETTVVSCIGLCFALALVAQMLGYSVALGAFLAGALVGESGDGDTVEHLIAPLRDMFAAIFFVSVGMLINPALIVEHWSAVVVFTFVVVVGKVIGVAVGAFFTGQGIRTSIQSGMSLAQIGEFSFIIASAGVTSGATRDFLYPLAVAVSAATTLLTPWLIRASDPVASFIDRSLPRPIQTFAALYGTWVEQLRTGSREQTVGRRVRRLGRLLLLDGALLTGIIVTTSVWGGIGADRVSAMLHLPRTGGWFAILVAAGVVALPFCIGIARCIAALAHALGETALPRTAGKVDLADAPRRALEITLEFALLLLVGIPLAAVTQPFVSPLPGAALLVMAIAVLAFALWRSATNLQEHTRAGAQGIVEVLVRQARSAGAGSPPPADLEQFQRVLPGLGAPVPIRVNEDSPAAGKTLAELDLRGLTGATVLAIVRGADSVLIPTGREALQPNDLLAIAGTAEAVDAAERVLSGQKSSE